VAGQIFRHRSTCVVGHRFAHEAVNLFDDSQFVGHEVVEGHIDRTLRCNGIAIADERVEHQREPFDPGGGDLLDRDRRPMHARGVGEHCDHRYRHRHRVAVRAHDGHTRENLVQHGQLLQVLRRLEQPAPAAP
jgi:hypothetical protein